MSNENKPLTAEEEKMLSEIDASRNRSRGGYIDYNASDVEVVSIIREYAAQQTAALREELEQYKSALDGKEQEKQEYKDKVELAVGEIQKLREELEGARKMVEWARFIMPFHGAAEYEPFHIEAEKYLSGNEPVIASPEDMVRLRGELEVVKKERDVFSKGFEAAREAITKACEQRDEAVKLLRDYRRADSNIAYKERFQVDSETDSFLSWLNSGETKPVSPWISVEERLPERR